MKAPRLSNIFLSFLKILIKHSMNSVKYLFITVSLEVSLFAHAVTAVTMDFCAVLVK